jgi:hypothetical protein
LAGSAVFFAAVFEPFDVETDGVGSGSDSPE